MSCAECRVFDGDPTCGACRAVARIVGLLHAGAFQAGQQRRVTEVLRSAAGELTDLVETNQASKNPPKAETEKEETTGPTSGPPKAPITKEAQKAQDAKSEYSYTEEEAESEVEAEEDKEVHKEGVETGEAPGKERELVNTPNSPGSPVLDEAARAEALAQRQAKFDPHYLTKRLCLTPAPKPHSGRGKEQANKRARKDSPGDKGGREKVEGSSSGAGRGGSDHRRDHHDEESEGRSPLPRRPREATGSRGKKTKGRKKRERTREFRAKKIEERRAKKARRDQQWPQKQKQKVWQWRS